MNHLYSSSIGIDISKDNLDLFHSSYKQSYRYKNTSQGIDRLIKYILKHPAECIVLEPSGGYERSLLQALSLKGIPFALVHAVKVRRFSQAQGKYAKTDKIDACILAQYGLRMHPPFTLLKEGYLQELRLWTHRRSQITKLIRLEKQALSCQEDQALIQLIKENITSFNAQLNAIDEKIKTLIEQNTSLKRKADLMSQEKGIGDVCKAVLLSYLPELGKLSNKKITALAGLAPYNQESGAWRGKQRIRGGRKEVRIVLYMAVISAIRYNQKIKLFYDRLKKAGKSTKIALTACMRKLLIILNGTLRLNLKENNPHI